MKILSIIPWNDGTGDRIIVRIEGYDHAQPTFPATIKSEELKVALLNWKIAQDASDVLNAPKIPPPEPIVSAELTALVGKEM